MAEQIQYLTPEWRDEAEKRLKSELSPERMNFITSSMSNIYLNCPDGKARYLFFRFDDPIVIHEDHCEPLSVFPLTIDEIN
jgi:hypothetical protein